MFYDAILLQRRTFVKIRTSDWVSLMNSDVVHLGDLLRRHGLHLKKRLGQNFLADPVHLDRIVAAAELGLDDVVLEIGPGVGTLTARLARQAGQVIAVELDAGLLPALRETLSPYPNVTIVQGDILQLDLVQLLSRIAYPAETATLDGIDNSQFTIHNSQFKVVANLPYYITSAAIRHLLSDVRPSRIDRSHRAARGGPAHHRQAAGDEFAGRQCAALCPARDRGAHPGRRVLSAAQGRFGHPAAASVATSPRGIPLRRRFL